MPGAGPARERIDMRAHQFGVCIRERSSPQPIGSRTCKQKLVALFHNLRLIARMNQPNYTEPAVAWTDGVEKSGIKKYGVANYGL